MDSDFSQFNSFNDQGTVILTPNRRLSATLHQLYQKYQCEQRQKVWKTPLIIPITTWITELWHDSKPSHESKPFHYLLNASQEQLLWEKIILSTKENEQLLQITETAELARSAWGLLKQWQVDFNHPLFQSSEDYIALYHWINQFQERCQKNQWIDAASLPDILIANLNNSNQTSIKKIITYGFTEYSPQLNALFKSLEKKGVVISCLTLFTHPNNIRQRIRLTDHEQEIETMAKWAKSLYQTNPKLSIGCVIPSLDKQRDRVAQIFSEIFTDETSYTLDTQTFPFNISAGKSLSQYPIINTALGILSLQNKAIPTSTFSYLIASPFLGEAEIERIKRAQYDTKLRFHNKNTIKLSEIINTSDEKNPLALNQSCPLLAKRLSNLMAILNTKAGTLESYESYTEWAKIFSERLTLLGWPGERSLNSEEYQIVESWLTLLNEFCLLDHITESGTAASFNQALHVLQKMAANTVFQAKSPTAPIQVLGLLEAAGMPFDYLWVAGMDDVSWPPQPKPNPFIPKRLQRDLRMPHATAERELTFCRLMTEQFKQSASRVIISHAEKRDELELQPSALIRDLQEINLHSIPIANYLSPAQRIFNTRKMELLIDEQAPAINDSEKIRGGVSIIKQQALCPFKAFSQWRLHAHPLETPLPGLRAKDRGNIIHQSLEILWKQIQNQQTLIELIALNDESLNQIIANSIDQALTKTPVSHSESKQYLSLEKKRLHVLIREWLMIEKTRPPFKIIQHEVSMTGTFGSLALTVRVDRLDELADGKKLIIDYKTGKNNEIASWFGQRPEEPQLPLYSLLEPTQTCGITFAQIHPGENCFKGISEYDTDIQGIKQITSLKKEKISSWDQQLTDWKMTLTQLSEDFSNGLAQVDPKDPRETCNWCELKPLCRINEEISTL